MIGMLVPIIPPFSLSNDMRGSQYRTVHKIPSSIFELWHVQGVKIRRSGGLPPKLVLHPLWRCSLQPFPSNDERLPIGANQRA